MENCDGGEKMISFNFDYYRPNTIEEAIKAYEKATGEGKSVIYFSGGTEIISLSRAKQIHFDAVIDIKSIPECNVYELKSGNLEIGAAVSLTKICDYNKFPLMSSVCRRIAEHTARNMITLGGNIFGRIPYKEALLPLILTDSTGVIAGKNGISTKPLSDIFSKDPLLQGEEFLVKVTINDDYIGLPYYHAKKTKQEKIDYPLITIASIKTKEKLRIAFSGLCSHPFKVVSDLDDNARNVMSNITRPIVNDILGSAEYRRFVTNNVLTEMYERYGGVN